VTTDIQVYAPTEMWQGQELKLIKAQVVPKDTTDEELLLFFKICQHAGLDPFTKQIYAIRRSGKLSIETSINGYRLIAHTSEAFAGVDEAEYDTETEKHPNWARVTVYRMVQGQRQPFTAKVRWDEFGATAVGPNWKSMPYHMLSKVAESHALRKAFQERLTAIYTSDEMEQAGYVDATSITVTEEPQEEAEQGETTTAKPKTLKQLEAEVKALCEQFDINPKVVNHYAQLGKLKFDVKGLTTLVQWLNNKDARPRLYVYTWGMKNLINPDVMDRLFKEEIKDHDNISSWGEFWERVKANSDEWAVRLVDLMTEESEPQPAA
jgi:phage recombination protein Bet